MLVSAWDSERGRRWQLTSLNEDLHGYWCLLKFYVCSCVVVSVGE
jgi:hypothetical protein